MSDDVPPRSGQYTITDPRALRAMSHPVRLALLEVLLSGPLTATQAGERIGESPTTCSFHLRQLARYGFVEEAGGGKGRARPWRLVHRGWRAPAQPDNPEFTRASQTLDQVLLERYFQRLRRFVDTAPGYPREWYEAAAAHENIWYLTPAELTEFAEAYRQLAQRFGERVRDRHEHPEQRPDGARVVDTQFFAYPFDLPE